MKGERQVVTECDAGAFSRVDAQAVLREIPTECADRCAGAEGINVTFVLMPRVRTTLWVALPFALVGDYAAIDVRSRCERGNARADAVP